MAESFFDLSPEDRREALEFARAQTGRPAHLFEKDVWVVWTLRALFESPRHPYSRGLLAAQPDLSGPRRRLAAIPGSVPEPGGLATGCTFAARCPVAEPHCAGLSPPPRAVGPQHRLACHRA